MPGAQPAAVLPLDVDGVLVAIGFDLLAALEELFGRKVDLLTRRSLRNPYFIDSVEKTLQLLYAA